MESDIGKNKRLPEKRMPLIVPLVLFLAGMACLDTADGNGGIDNQRARRVFDGVKSFLDSGAGFMPVARHNFESQVTPTSR